MVAEKTHLIFDSNIGGTKPVTMVHNVACPFCCRDKLEGIIAQDGPIILLRNKYPVLRDTVQTVLIETYECDSELSLYPKDHLYKVISFGVEKWQEMINSGQFASVLFYKNHGPYSGGTIRHPHMQIVGLKDIDYSNNITPESLQGAIIFRDTGVELNLSDQPKIGFFEFNIKLLDLQYINRLADYIQIVTHYILNHFSKRCNSYNLFFYQLNNAITVKIMPRFVTSPLFIGYSIPQVASRMSAVIREMQDLYR
jgi:ATP adenylyltransferase/5',5'''-P-1,P-4-tetraphosphate phosphorylase II